jgi:GT2 family glycosyltransferase
MLRALLRRLTDHLLPDPGDSPAAAEVRRVLRLLAFAAPSAGRLLDRASPNRGRPRGLGSLMLLLGNALRVLDSLSLPHWVEASGLSARRHLADNRLTPADRAAMERLAAGWADPPVFTVLTADASDASPQAASLRGQVYRRWELLPVASAASAAGGWLALPEPGDTLDPGLLWEAADALRRNPSADALYTDACLWIDGRPRLHLAPDWSPDTLLSGPYFGGLLVVRAALFGSLGGLRADRGPAAPYDLLLRLAEVTDRVLHVPGALVHRTLDPARRPDPAPFRRALADALSRRGIAAEPTPIPRLPAEASPAFRLTFAPGDHGRVSIVIPTRDGLSVLRPCVEGLLRLTRYPDYELLVIDNGSADPDALAYLDALRTRGHRVLRIASGPEGFNYSRINNLAAAEATGRYLLLLNNDTVVRHADWLDQMVGRLRMPGVGAVGARLLYPDGTVQHAGVLVDVVRGNAAHAFAGAAPDDPGHLGQAVRTRNCSAVTAACLLTHTHLFRELGGLEDRQLRVAYSDVDYCLRLQQAGYRVVYAPEAELDHHESHSRGRVPDYAEVRALAERLRRRGDPYHNPNLRSFPPYHTLTGRRRPRRPPEARAVRVIAAVGDLSGDDRAAAEDLLAGLAGRDDLELVRLTRADDARACAEAVGAAVREGRAPVILAVGWDAAPAVAAARPAVSAVWSLPGRLQPWVSPRLPAGGWSRRLRLAGSAYAVVTGSHIARGALVPWLARRNLEVIPPGFDPAPADDFLRSLPRPAARSRLGVAEGEFVVICCDPPGSRTEAAAAVEILRRTGRGAIRLVFPDDHPAERRAWFAAADLLASHLADRPWPRFTLEARAFALPVAAAYGTNEQVVADNRGMTYPLGDAEALAGCIARAADDPDLRSRMGRQGRWWLECLARPDDTADAFARLLTEASELSA